jgi:two-component system sensor histidine kinase BaeS
MRLKLFLSFILIILVSVSLVAVMARRGAVNEVRTFMFRGGMYGLSDLATGLENYYRSNSSWQGIQTIFRSSHGGILGFGGILNQRLELANPTGLVVADTQSTAVGTKLTSSQLDNSITLVVDGKTVGYLYAVGGLTLNSGNEQQVLNRLNRGVFLAGLVSVALGLVISLALAYTLLRPVRALTIASQKLAEGDLTQRVEVHGNDELATLGHTFNQMADSLQQAEEARRAMTADIAHELRTPLAVQRANLEALQDGVYPLATENLAPAIEQNYLLTHLVEDLRTLALADAGQIELERAPIDLLSLVTRVVERFQPQATSQQVKISIINPAPSLPVISVDHLRIEQILTNLLSNALRYTSENGKVELTFDTTPTTILLRVHDTGPGIPTESLPYIFGRFYRVEKSRSRTEGGSGLGLAIARQLARAHGGDLTVANHPSGGAVFTLILPL